MTKQPDFERIKKEQKQIRETQEIALKVCQQINPSNPLAVAHNIKRMYETLLYALHLQGYIENGIPTDMPSMVLESVREVLAAIERKG